MSPAPVHLVFGVTGQVGYDLARELAPLGRVIGLSRAEADLERIESVRDAIPLHRPAVIWNAAAATAVDALEDDPDLAFRVNATAPGVMAEEATRLGARLVHFSTDYVFDGTKREPYVEDDAPNPLNVYGRSKLAGEIAIRDAGARHLILRTGWVYSSRGRNFVRAILPRADAFAVLRVVNDQVGAPTWSRELARACAILAPRLSPHDSGSDVLHLSAAGTCSWFEFAAAIREQLIQSGVPWNAPLEPISGAEYGAKATRPGNSVLSNDRFVAAFGFRLAPWHEAMVTPIQECAERLRPS
jgi:dTDP-4-dehydrorhamnose reductase